MEEKNPDVVEISRHEKLKNYILKKHIKQAGLAREIGIDPSTFCVKLAGVTHKFTDQEYEKLETILEIKIDQL